MPSKTKVFHLAIAMKNAAFDDPNACSELARLLKGIAQLIEDEEPIMPYSFKDKNGNDCGNAWLSWEA
jgi:hypothetical protein